MMLSDTTSYADVSIIINLENDKLKKYTYEEALKLSLEYFNGNELATKVFVDKYALRDNEGNILEPTPKEMHERLASEFARIDSEKYGLNYDERYSIYFAALDKFARIVAQGSPMAAIGNKYQTLSASNCVVIESPEDNIDSIIDAGKNIAQLTKRRCGVGLDISTLRPDGLAVNNAARTTSGAWSFADLYSYITRFIGQGGRRGALMITMDVHHPDITKFATMKQDKTKVTGANVSVRLSDAFLKAVENNKEYEQRWPIEGEPKVVKKVNARDVWNVIVESATTTAEPGLVMWDNMINNLPPHCYEEFKTISTNPCSEIALSAFDSCRLLSINLTAYTKDPFTKNASFDYEAFAADVATTQQMADNLVDLELELIEKIKKACKPGAEKDLWNKLSKAGLNGRRTGTGTHGLADTLAQLCLRYDEEDALKVVDKIYKTLRNVAYDTSVELARVRGAFPVYDWDKEQDCDFIKRLPKDIKEKMQKYGRRNIALLTQAPTGSISLISKVGSFDSYNVSSGVEPVFRNSYVRRKKINHDDKTSNVDFVDIVGDKWTEFTVYHSNVQNYLALKGLDDKAKLPDYFITSDQIDWMKRVELQGVEQKYIDHSISSTINLPRGTNSETVGKLYLEAWKKGLKGVTVYVDGCRDGVLITNTDKKDKDGRPTAIIHADAPKRPTELPCELYTATVKGQKWTVLIGLLDEKPYEIFTGLSENLQLPAKCTQGKIVKVNKGQYNLHVDVGGEDLIIKDIIKVFDNPESAWATRMLSLSLRHGVSVDFVVDQLGRDGAMGDYNKVISRILKKFIKDGAKVRTSAKCPSCNSTDLTYQEGCVSCTCGYSKCN